MSNSTNLMSKTNQLTRNLIRSVPPPNKTKTTPIREKQVTKPQNYKMGFHKNEPQEKRKKGKEKSTLQKCWPEYLGGAAADFPEDDFIKAIDPFTTLNWDPHASTRSSATSGRCWNSRRSRWRGS